MVCKFDIQADPTEFDLKMPVFCDFLKISLARTATIPFIPRTVMSRRRAMKIVRAIALVTLAFLGVGAVAGGAILILDPSGKLLQMPLSILDHSPFHSFLIPGIILLVANGILSLLIMIPVIRRTPGNGLWVAFQGCVLTGWITIEVIMVRLAVWPHSVYWAIGLDRKSTRLNSSHLG